MRTIWKMAFGVVLATGVGVGLTAAQTPKLIPVVGAVSSVTDNELSLTRGDGTVVAVKLTDKTRYSIITPMKIEDIKPNSYVGVGAKTGADGTVTAIVVTVFPESARGVGEGSKPWNQGNDSTMTNGTVSQVVATNGHTLTVTYKGGQQVIVVPDGTQVTGFQLTDKSALVPGTPVLVRAVQSDSSEFDAVSVNIGAGGAVPKG